MNRSGNLKPFDVDMDQLLGDHGRLFNPLARPSQIDFRLVDARNGYAQISVVLPIEMTRHFEAFLESMSGMFRCSSRKALLKQTSSKALDASELERIKSDQESFSKQVCALFDDFILQGFTRNEAISRTNSSLKAQSHPWASYDIVQQVLRDQGRFRKRRPSSKTP